MNFQLFMMMIWWDTVCQCQTMMKIYFFLYSSDNRFFYELYSSFPSSDTLQSYKSKVTYQRQFHMNSYKLPEDASQLSLYS